jgi:hypothetical protein
MGAPTDADMTLRAIINRGKQLGALMKRGAELKSYAPVPFSSLTARSDYAANDRFAPKPRNEFTAREQRLIEELLQFMSKSRARIVDAHRRARQNPVT